MASAGRHGGDDDADSMLSEGQATGVAFSHLSLDEEMRSLTTTGGLSILRDPPQAPPRQQQTGTAAATGGAPLRSRSRSKSKGRNPAEDAAPRALSRGRTPGKSKVRRFINDNLIPARGIWGGAGDGGWDDAHLAAVLDHYYIELSHRSFLEPLMADREVLRAYRRGEVGYLPAQSAAARTPAPAAALRRAPTPLTLRSWLGASYAAIRGERSLLLREARRALAAPSGHAPLMLEGLEALVVSLILTGGVGAVMGRGGGETEAALDACVGVELACALTARPAVLDGRLELPFESSYLRLLSHGLASFYRIPSVSVGSEAEGGRRVLVGPVPLEVTDHVAAACAHLRGAPRGVPSGGVADGVREGSEGLVPLFVTYVRSLGAGGGCTV